MVFANLWMKVASALEWLTLPMLRLLSSEAQGCKHFWKPSLPCHIGIHWKALAEYSQMRPICQGFSEFSGCVHHFVMAKFATSSIKVNTSLCTQFGSFPHISVWILLYLLTWDRSWQACFLLLFVLSFSISLFLTLPMLRLLTSNAQERRDFWRPSKPCHMGFIGSLSQSTLRWVPTFQGFSHFSESLQYFVMAKLATSSMRWGLK